MTPAPAKPFQFVLRRAAVAKKYAGPIIFASIYLAIAATNLLQLWKKHAASSWTPIQAEVLDASADGRYIEIAYEYAVDGRQYRGDRWSYMNDWIPEAEYVRRHLGRGAPLKVHVNPADPGQSVVLASPIRFTDLEITIALLPVFTLIAIASLILARKSAT